MDARGVGGGGMIFSSCSWRDLNPQNLPVGELRQKSDPGMSAISFQGQEFQVPTDVLTVFVISN